MGVGGGDQDSRDHLGRCPPTRPVPLSLHYDKEINRKTHRCGTLKKHLETQCQGVALLHLISKPLRLGGDKEQIKAAYY
jgi:hypothetical protein